MWRCTNSGKQATGPGFIEAAVARTVTAIGVPPTRSTAGFWFNLMEELRNTEDDLWISRQGETFWWTVSQAGPLRETLQPSDRPDRNGPVVWVLEKSCRPWSDRDGKGRRLKCKTIHPKARDFLSTEATFQRVANDRDYADYARALVAGEPLDPWHTRPLFADKAAEAKQAHGRIFTARERTAARKAQTMLATIAAADGRIVERHVKVKTATLSAGDCERLLLQKMGEQEDRCALTGLPLGYDRECDDTEMLASLDRVDSGGHYMPDNVQIVCRIINQWKGADEDVLARRLLSVLSQHFRREPLAQR